MFTVFGFSVVLPRALLALAVALTMGRMNGLSVQHREHHYHYY